jgi:hypothetical protein
MVCSYRLDSVSNESSRVGHLKLGIGIDHIHNVESTVRRVTTVQTFDVCDKFDREQYKVV